MAKAFEFADFVREFWVDFTVYDKQPGYRDPKQGNKWIEGAETPRETGGIVLPLTEDDLKTSTNGISVEKDRKVYTLEPLTISQRLEYGGQSYTIMNYKDYSAYADVYIYIGKGVAT